MSVWRKYQATAALKKVIWRSVAQTAQDAAVLPELSVLLNFSTDGLSYSRAMKKYRQWESTAAQTAQDAAALPVLSVRRTAVRSNCFVSGDDMGSL